MKKSLKLWCLLAGISLAGCQENERMLYSRKGCVYFSSITEKDSISYSFASGLKDEDTVKIPIRIIGPSLAYERKISIETDPCSTAKENVHYKRISRDIPLKAGTVDADVPIKVFNRELEKGDVQLILNLKPNEDFDLGYTGSLKAKLVITAKLIKPAFWERPLSLYYGSYSKAKHRLCIRLQGFDFPEKLEFGMIPAYMSYGRMVYNYLLKNPVWDEETQKWITADWSPL